MIGALERSKYGQHERFKEMPAADPQGTHRCCGLGFDCPEEDWDAFARKLREVIDVRFEPIPATRWLKIRLEEVHGRTICVIDITRPDEWFWVNVAARDTSKRSENGARGLQAKFFVRVEGMSKELKGRAIDEYKRTQSRRDS